MSRRLSSALAWLVVSALPSALLVAQPAGAHDVQAPISGDGVVVRGVPAVSSGSEEFSFSSTDPNILVSHDPAQAGTWVLVRGEGANAGRTPLIALDPTMWGAGVSGFVYDDATGGADGITSVVLDDGALSIAGSGSGWPWSPAGAQDAVWVHFRIADEWFCAEFPGVGASVNAAGDFQSDAALAPVECPEVVCGNGVIEGLEACDDGNLVEDDGCTSACEVGECTAQEFASTYESIHRIVDTFPADQHNQVQAQLAFVLQGVIAQQLIPRSRGRGRVMCAEVLICTQAVRALVREGKVHQVYSHMQAGQKYGMQTMNQALFAAVVSGDISQEDAVEYSMDPRELTEMYEKRGVESRGRDRRRPAA